jgi:hypothetical protein
LMLTLASDETAISGWNDDREGNGARIV